MKSNISAPIFLTALLLAFGSGVGVCAEQPGSSPVKIMPSETSPDAQKKAEALVDSKNAADDKADAPKKSDPKPDSSPLTGFITLSKEALEKNEYKPGDPNAGKAKSDGGALPRGVFGKGDKKEEGFLEKMAREDAKKEEKFIENISDELNTEFFKGYGFIESLDTEKLDKRIKDEDGTVKTEDDDKVKIIREYSKVSKKSPVAVLLKETRIFKKDDKETEGRSVEYFKPDEDFKSALFFYDDGAKKPGTVIVTRKEDFFKPSAVTTIKLDGDKVLKITTGLAKEILPADGVRRFDVRREYIEYFMEGVPNGERGLDVEIFKLEGERPKTLKKYSTTIA